MRGCLGEEAVLAFVSGSATGPSRRAAEVHLASCPECRALVSELARRSARGGNTQPMTPPGSLPSPGGTSGVSAFARTVPSERPPPGGSPLVPGEVLDGKYEVEWVIGAGGMGVVVAAWHRPLGCRVAIKVMGAHLRGAPEARERLLREARACARLRSEHTVRVLDVGTLDDGAPFVVMEYLVGRSLSDRLREEGPLPVGEAVETVLHACAALEESHAAGIVHRDLKPSNLFETRRFDGVRIVKVIDFGIAKGPSLASDSAATATRGVMGSPGYMAPEQLRSTRDADARADLWALGVTLCELLTGELGPRADGSVPVRIAGLDRVVRRCLEHDPARRFASARELSEALRPFRGSAVEGKGRRRTAWGWIPAVAVASAVLAGGVTLAIARRGSAPEAASTPTPTPTPTPAPAPAPALASASPPSASTSRAAPRIIVPTATARPAPATPPPSVVDPHGLLDRK